jgi:hypothetical protein
MRAVFQRVGNLLLDLGNRPLVHQRADLDAGFEPVPTLRASMRALKAWHRRPSVRTLHIDAVGGQAVLARGGELRIDRDI